ncbi:MAG: ATP-binding protein [Candidatus Caldarchaeum sp.]|nr:ATP-binding protein [Candidatus Caldarchaeum sp.]
MLFDLRPKERLSDLYGRREDFDELSRYVESGLWVVVLGRRMTGKTSLVKTFVREKKGVYVNLMDVKGMEGLVERLASSAGLQLRELRLGLQFAELKWTKAAGNIFATLQDKVVVFDEVQEIVSPQFLKLLKNLWDTYPRLRLIFTGSYVGVLKKLAEPSSTTPLFGRQPAKIILKPFTREMSIDFLQKGFRQFKLIPKQSELEEAVEKLNGYVGWLTYYGNFRCVRKEPHDEALENSLREGVKIMREELNRFLENKKRETYLKILKTAVFGARWNEIAEKVQVNRKVLSEAVKKLVDVGFLSKDAEVYVVPDPVLREAVKRMRG